MRKADNLPPSCAVVMNSGNLNFLEPSGPVQACNGTALPSTEIAADIFSETQSLPVQIVPQQKTLYFYFIEHAENVLLCSEYRQHSSELCSVGTAHVPCAMLR